MLRRLAQLPLAAVGAPQQPASLLAAAVRLMGAVEQQQRAALHASASWRSSEQQPAPEGKPDLPRQAVSCRTHPQWCLRIPMAALLGLLSHRRRRRCRRRQLASPHPSHPALPACSSSTACCTAADSAASWSWTCS